VTQRYSALAPLARLFDELDASASQQFGVAF